MELRTCNLDQGLTVAEVDTGTNHAWHFLPFEDRRANLHALDDRTILAEGRSPRDHAITVWDRLERRCLVAEANPLMTVWGDVRGNSWCYDPARRSLFVLETSEQRPSGERNPAQCVRQLPFDGSTNRRFRLGEEEHASVLVPRDDGRIVAISLGKAFVLDPDTGAVNRSETDLIGINVENGRYDQLRWFSPDGRWGMRWHLGSVVRHEPARPGVRRLWSRLTGNDREVGDADPPHPDLVYDGQRRFGLALELFRLDPIGLERRLIVRYVTPGEFAPDLDHWYYGVSLPDLAHQQADLARSLDALADELDHRRWDGRSRKFLAPHPFDGRPHHDLEAADRVAKQYLSQMRHVRWDADSHGFTVVVGDRERHVALDGTLGSLAPTAWVDPYRAERVYPSEEAIRAIGAAVRERSVHRITMSDLSAASIAAALREMRRRIEEDGLDALVFGDMLQFRFRVGGRLIGERKLFEAARALGGADLAGVIADLRALMIGYGRAARTFQTRNFGPISSGHSEAAHAALSEAAITLALLDDRAFESLRDWFVTVDQEHDTFAAGKVFPAIARRTGFATPEAVEFGLWFFLQQWQTVSYERSYHGLFKAAEAVVESATFARMVVETAHDVSGFSQTTDLESCRSTVEEWLGRSLWARSVRAELDRLFADAGAGG